MFKKPVELNVNTQNVAVTHRIAVSDYTLARLSRTVTETSVAVGVVAVGVLTVKATLDIIKHIAETKIK